MKTKLTFLLSLTFLFLFSGSVYGDEQDGLQTEKYEWGEVRTNYKNGKKEGLETSKLKRNIDLESYIKTQYISIGEDNNQTKNKLNTLEETKGIHLFDGSYNEWEYFAYDDGIFPISDSMLIPKSYSQNIDTKKHPFIKPFLDYINDPFQFKFSKKIIISNAWTLGDKSIIFFNLKYLEKHSSEFDTEDRYRGRGKSSFLFFNNQFILDPEHKIGNMGEGDTRGAFRELWDIFKHEGKEYILIHARYWEWEVFEVYQINEYNLELKLKVSIDGI